MASDDGATTTRRFHRARHARRLRTVLCYRCIDARVFLRRNLSEYYRSIDLRFACREMAKSTGSLYSLEIQVEYADRRHFSERYG